MDDFEGDVILKSHRTVSAFVSYRACKTYALPL